MSFYNQSIKEILKELKTNTTTGLSHTEASRRLAKYGLNVLPTREKPPAIYKFFAQFKNTLVIILLAATGTSWILGDKLDAVAIAAIVILNATIGFIQEVQAEKTLAALSEKEILYALVLRDGKIDKIPADQITIGDILILEEGAKIAADGRLIEAFSFSVDESILTGESLAVSKNTDTIAADEIPLADRKNYIFKDTQIVSGRGKAVVCAIGADTEMGKIALFLEETKEVKSPLTLELDRVGRSLSIVIGIIALAIFVLNFASRVPLVDSLLISISLAVAAIPEGLPAIVTIVLSLGVKRLADKKTLVKKLPAVETLGAVRIIATDKTGTLTQNKINVTNIIAADGNEYFIEGEGYSPKGVFFDKNGKIIDVQKQPSLLHLLKAAALANNATISHNSPIPPLTVRGGEGGVTILGDTTEGALLVAAARANLNIEEIRESEKRLYEIPFSSERKMMSVVVRVDETSDHLLYSKGAPEVILPKCTSSRPGLETEAHKMASEGLRPLAVAFKKLTKPEVKKALEENILDETGFTYLGLVGMQDPLRPEVTDAISAAQNAGIRTIMITGDHKETALTIAQQAGIIPSDAVIPTKRSAWRDLSRMRDLRQAERFLDKLEMTNQVLTETDLSKMDDKELIHAIKGGANVFARISPFTKLRIVEAIKKMPNTQVAVTGDGVNDAPALSCAHIGVAMGKSGTDVTREIADIVITDDNYATIVVAVEEGRIIYANLVKFIRYLISCNLSEVIVIAAGVILGTPIPLLPIQILWINLITDGLPALALGVDPPEYDVMKKPPRDLSEGILHKKRWAYMTIEGTIMGASVFLLFLYALANHSYAEAQTMAFAALALSQLVHAFNNRSIHRSLFRVGILSNKYLIITGIASVILQILVIQTTWGNLIFKTTNLARDHWLLIVSVSLIPFFMVELKKQLRFRLLP